ncbi:MAG: hypothetical protein ABI596_09780 [Pyrinomonadaceae bacterium]
MKMKIATVLFGLAIMFAPAPPAAAQETQAPAQPTEEEKAKEKAATEKKAFTLLDQVVAEASSLKLAENRIRIQISAADLLWDRQEARARALYSQAADGVAELIRTTDTREPNQRPRPDQGRNPSQLRQELVLSVARHDAPMAYQVLASTRSLTPPPIDTGMGPQISPEENLEQLLLARVAAIDPKLALQNAELLLEKGQYPRTLTSVLSQLQRKDKEAAAKLESKLVQRLQSENMLAKIDAGNLAISMLAPGPRVVSTSTDAAAPAPKNTGQVLSESSYQDLMRTVIEAALKATPAPAGGQRGGNQGRQRGPNAGGQNAGRQNNVQVRTDAENEQDNARRLLSGVQSLLPKIDQYLPERAQSVRQKMTELGLGNNQRGGGMGQIMSSMQQGNADSLMAAAPSVPAQLQPRVYQAAAMKALEEGNVDRAREIATDHLDSRTRTAVLQSIDFRQMADKVETSRIEEVRQTLAGLTSDSQKIDLLLQLAEAAQKKNPKMTGQLLDEAQRLVSRPAVNYQQLDAQIRVAHAFAGLDPGRSFQVLEPGILQLNDLLSAAAVLNGFEVNVFREGELPLQGGSGLGSMINRYAQELAMLARSDFDRAQTLVNRFALSEPRIQARLAIVQGLLRPQAPQAPDSIFGMRNFGQSFPMVRSPE